MENFKEIFPQKLIMAFVNFYGKENKQYIEKRFNDCKVILYDGMPLQENDNIRNHIKTNISEEQLNVIFNARKDKVFLRSAYIEEFDLLVLPQNFNMTHWIHECNHMLSSRIMSMHPLKSLSGISETIEIDGFVQVFDEFLNETINQLMTIEIIESLGEDPEPSWQQEMFPIINDFYSVFKEELKKLYILGNLDEFKNNVGKYYFTQFSQAVFRCGFKIRRSLVKGQKIQILGDEITHIQRMVQIMKNNSMQASL